MSNEELALLVRDGNADAVLQLWEQTKRFAFQQARRYLGICEMEDLEQAGFIAVIRAAKTYEPAREVKFLTHLGFYLKQEFPRANGLKNTDPLHNAISLDTPLSDEKDAATIGDLEPDPRDHLGEVERRIYHEQLRQQLNKAVAQLPEDQQQIIRLRYYAGLSLKQTGETMMEPLQKMKNEERKALQTLRKQRELEQFIEDRTPYYVHVGVNQFNTTHESIVEKCVIIREKIRREFENEHSRKNSEENC